MKHEIRQIMSKTFTQNSFRYGKYLTKYKCITVVGRVFMCDVLSFATADLYLP